MIEIAPSLLSSTNRIEDIKKLNNTDCRFIHIDVIQLNNLQLIIIFTTLFYFSIKII